jgi:ADP-ribose pyrophosphatase
MTVEGRGRDFERLGGETAWEGAIVRVVRDRFRYEDGDVVEREIVRHPGAVGVVAHDDLHVWLVRQPRETIGDPDVLEIPAGKLDLPGESPLECARRELGEEIGKDAAHWEPVLSFATSIGVSDELVHLFHATGLRESEGSPDPGERIEVVAWPLDDLEGALGATVDSKTLIGLMWLRERLRRHGSSPPEGVA